MHELKEKFGHIKKVFQIAIETNTLNDSKSLCYVQISIFLIFDLNFFMNNFFFYGSFD